MLVRGELLPTMCHQTLSWPCWGHWNVDCHQWMVRNVNDWRNIWYRCNVTCLQKRLAVIDTAHKSEVIVRKIEKKIPFWWIGIIDLDFDDCFWPLGDQSCLYDMGGAPAPPSTPNSAVLVLSWCRFFFYNRCFIATTHKQPNKYTFYNKDYDLNKRSFLCYTSTTYVHTAVIYYLVHCSQHCGLSTYFLSH